MKRSPALLTITATLGAALLLSGCASPSGSSPIDGSAEHNDADVTFAQMMIPHHEQAVEMSDIILGKDDIDPAVTDLATQIKDAQRPEIEQLNELLASWGEDAGMTGEMEGMDHGGDGMMSTEDMDDLSSASGADADRLFLQQMIQHHEGAIEMAETQIADGQHPDARALAESIVTTQADEIATMEELLGS